MGKLNLSDESSIIWAKDLDLRHHDQSFNETKIPADELHSQLSSGGNLLKDSVKPKLANSQTDAGNDPKPNFLIVNIGYILSQPAKNGSKFVSFPIRVLGENFYSVQSSWEEDGKTKRDAAQSMETRYIHGWNHTPQTKKFTKVQENGPLHYNDNVDGPTYENKFHHSEQALYEYLIKPNVVKSLLERLRQAGVPNGTEIQGIIIDMHSTRYVCGNCELGAMGIMSPEYQFLKTFSQKAQECGYSYNRDENEIAIRVTANKPDGVLRKVSSSSHLLSPESSVMGHRPEDMKSRTIYQRDIDATNLSGVESDLHRRSAFISSHVTTNKNYTDSYDQVVVGEYTSMLAKARGMKAAREFRRDHEQDEGCITVTKFQDKKIKKSLSQKEEMGMKLSDEETRAFEEVVGISSRKDVSVLEQARKLHGERVSYERDIKKGGDGTGRK